MFDFTNPIGGIFESVQHIRDAKEREDYAVMLAGMVLSSWIEFLYSLGMGIQKKSPFWKWMGYCFTHTAASLYTLAIEQDIAKRIVLAVPQDLVKNTGLLDSIHFEESIRK